jgi:hypothetical protein
MGPSGFQLTVFVLHVIKSGGAQCEWRRRGRGGGGGGFGVRPLARVTNNLGDVPHQNCQPPILNEAFYLAVLEEPLKLDNYVISE